MKKLILIVALIALMAFSISCTNAEEDMIVLSINDIQSDPLSFTGKLKINGVVSDFYENDNSVFSIMDTAELLFCKDLYCGAYALAVKNTGNDAIPELADDIDVIGSWGEYEGHVIFEVTNITVKRNIMPLLTNNSSGGGS